MIKHALEMNTYKCEKINNNYISVGLEDSISVGWNGQLCKMFGRFAKILRRFRSMRFIKDNTNIVST